jgi:hypothetical protein
MKPLLVVLALVRSRPVAAEPQQLRIATLAPSGSPWTEFLERAAAEITSETDGRITFKYFTGGQQGDERDFIRKINLGQLDGAAVTSAGLAMIDPSILDTAEHHRDLDAPTDREHVVGVALISPTTPPPLRPLVPTIDPVMPASIRISGSATASVLATSTSTDASAAAHLIRTGRIRSTTRCASS